MVISGECDFDTFSEEMEDMITYLSITGICSATEGCSDDCFGTFVDVFTNHCFRVSITHFVPRRTGGVQHPLPEPVSHKSS